jgi:hypothetical protein
MEMAVPAWVHSAWSVHGLGKCVDLLRALHSPQEEPQAAQHGQDSEHLQSLHLFLFSLFAQQLVSVSALRCLHRT